MASVTFAELAVLVSAGDSFGMSFSFFYVASEQIVFEVDEDESVNDSADDNFDKGAEDGGGKDARDCENGDEHNKGGKAIFPRAFYGV